MSKGGIGRGACGLGFIGAAIYYIQQAASFGDVLVGVRGPQDDAIFEQVTPIRAI